MIACSAGLVSVDVIDLRYPFKAFWLVKEHPMKTSEERRRRWAYVGLLCALTKGWFGSSVCCD